MAIYARAQTKMLRKIRCCRYDEAIEVAARRRGRAAASSRWHFPYQFDGDAAVRQQAGDKVR